MRTATCNMASGGKPAQHTALSAASEPPRREGASEGGGVCLQQPTHLSAQQQLNNVVKEPYSNKKKFRTVNKESLHCYSHRMQN